MPSAPDVLALELPAALDILAKAGWRVADLVRARPPRAGDGVGEERVVRQRVLAPGEVQLVVVHIAHERCA